VVCHHRRGTGFVRGKVRFHPGIIARNGA
jgi:hypothetical protein